MRGVCFGLFTIALVATFASAGQQDARAIIDRAIQATGGEENLKSFPAVTFAEKGTYHGLGKPLPYTGKYAIQLPDRSRMEIEGVFLMVANGDKGWIKTQNG